MIHGEIAHRLRTIYSIMASSTIIFAKAESSLVTPDS